LADYTTTPKEFNLALDYWKKALALQQEIGDKLSVASCMNNLGIVYSDKEDYKMSLMYYFRSLSMYGPKSICARRYPLQNIGDIYFKNEEI